MKKKNYSVMGLVQKAIMDSMNFSKSDKSHIFIYVYPHVSCVNFEAHQGGWKESNEPTFSIRIYTRGSLAPTVKETKKMLKPLYDFIKKNSNQ